MSASASHEVLEAFRGLVGREHVLDDPATRARYGAATFPTEQRVAAVVRPADRDQVRACVRLAGERGVALYPVSRGCNWGLGSRVPTADGAVVLDLCRLDRIVTIDEDLAYATVEPGVTFEALYQELGRRGSRLFVASNGASPRGSVLANALERGDGAGPYGDRVHHVAGIQAVLSTGELVSSGFRRCGPGPLAPLHRVGVGPSIDGLLSQSNLAVVTELTTWLAPLPRALSVVRFSIPTHQGLAPAVDVVRRLRLDGTLRGAAGFWNDYRVLSTSERYPWHATGGRTPLPRTTLAVLAERWGGARWFGSLALQGATPAQAEAHAAHARDLLAPHVTGLTVSARSGEPRSGQELFHEAEPSFRFFQGIPHEASLESVYWRKREPRTGPIDPDGDGCGVLWACPCVPLTGEHVVRATALAEELMLADGFEPLHAVIAQSDRTAYFVPLLIYDRAVDGEDERALACHHRLLTRLAAEGYLPYRLGVQSMGHWPPSVDDTDAVLARLKRAFDPAGVVAPGRYESRGRRGP